MGAKMGRWKAGDDGGCAAMEGELEWRGGETVFSLHGTWMMMQRLIPAGIVASNCPTNPSPLAGSAVNKYPFLLFGPPFVRWPPCPVPPARAGLPHLSAEKGNLPMAKTRSIGQKLVIQVCSALRWPC